MNIALGQSALLLALLGAVAGAITLVVGLGTGRPSLLRAGQTYIWLVVAGAVLATVAMQRALITHDFTLVYVDNNDSTFTPLLYRVTAMWSDLAGSILLWALYPLRLPGRDVVPLPPAAQRTVRSVGQNRRVRGGGVLLRAHADGVQPVRPGPWSRAQPGPWPRPVASGPGAGGLPPATFVPRPGRVHRAVLPGRGRPGDGARGAPRGSLKPVAGPYSRGPALRPASYSAPGGATRSSGWGGYWSWDPVENSALLPWLTATAFLHSAMVQQRRAMLRVWNLSLLLATFSLTILGTFFTRSGVLVSVHSFTADGGVGPALLVFFGLVVATSIGLLAWRGDELHSRGSIETPVSREGAFLANNLLFAVFAFVVLLGTVFPLFVEAVNGSSITVGGPFFDTMTLPLVLCLLFLMAVAPVLPWRRASGELLLQRLLWPAVAAVVVLVVCVAAGLRGFWPLVVFTLAGFAGASAVRQLVLLVRRTGWRGFTGRSGGGMVVHLGVVLIAVAFAASHAYEHQAQLTLAVGKPATFQGQTIVFRGVKTVNAPGKTSLVATVDLNGHDYYPAVEQFALSNDAVPSPAVRSTATKDIYLTLASVPSTPKAPAAIGVIVEPLVLWLWVGGFVIVIGAFLSLWPSSRDRHIVLEGDGEAAAVGQDSLLPSDEEPEEAGVGAPI